MGKRSNKFLNILKLEAGCGIKGEYFFSSNHSSPSSQKDNWEITIFYQFGKLKIEKNNTTRIHLQTI